MILITQKWKASYVKLSNIKKSEISYLRILQATIIGWMYKGIFWSHRWKFYTLKNTKIIWNIRHSDFGPNGPYQKFMLHIFEWRLSYYNQKSFAALIAQGRCTKTYFSSTSKSYHESFGQTAPNQS